MWKYDQSSGELTHNGASISHGYAGAGRGKNNPALQGVKGIGPIPRGRWKMMGVYNSSSVGPYAITLYSLDDAKLDDFHAPTGRSAFRIHGDSVKNPGTASKGCIVLPRAVRELMWRSGDRELEVVG